MTEELKKVSIIIPAYNEEKYLPGCLDAIVNINYPDDKIEVILVDNGSSDNTREIAEGYGVKILRDDSKNVSGLRNLGAANSTGEIIAFLDADCIVSSDWLKHASIYFEEMSVAAWGGPPVPPDDASWVQKTWFLVVQKDKPVEYVDWLATVDLFVRRENFLAAGTFNESLITCEDVDLSYRISKFGKLVSDSRIQLLHLREADTVKEFMKKEIWRGRGNYRGMLEHGLLLKEIPSLFVPLYFGILLPVLSVVSIVSLDPEFIILCIICYFLPALAVLIKTRRKNIGAVERLRLLFLVYIYFLARSIAILKF